MPTNILRIFRIVQAHKLRFAASQIAMALAAICTVGYSTLISPLVNDGMIAGDSERVVDLGVERGDPDAPGPFSLHDHRRIAQLLFGTGWSDVEISAVEQTLDYGGGGAVEELVQFAIDLGPIGRAIEEHPELETPIRHRLSEAIEERWSDGHVHLEAAVWVVTASS